MPGIEVAGLVLAVIPLFISAAEHYRQGLDAGKRCWNKDRILRQYRVELEFQRVYLVLNLKALLIDVDLDFSEKEALIGATDADTESLRSVPALNEVWEQAHVKAKIIQQLGEAHDSFVSLLQRESTPADCSLKLRAFHDKIKSAAGLLDGRALWQCIKFSWQDTGRNQMILNLQDNNDKLQILLRMLQAAKPFYAEQRSNRVQDIFGVRDQVRRMYRVLSQHSNCSHPAHQAKLSLRREYCERKRLDDACFETILYQTPSVPRQSTVRIASISAQAAPQITSITIGKNDDHDAWYTQERRALADICHAMSTVEAESLRLELVIDEDSKLWQILVPANTRSGASTCHYTLKDLLDAASLHRKEPKWLAREKKILTVILCHSLLQLDGTQWLDRGWHADTITCAQDEELSLAKAPRFRLTRPYVSANIMTTDMSLVIKTRGLATDEPHCHPIPSLLNLGVLLLELYLNGPLESAADVERLANIQLWAMSVLGSCREDKDMEPSYYNAIQFCLWPPWPPAGNCSFENAKFRDEYYQKVVVPLEEALTEGFDFTKEELAAL